MAKWIENESGRKRAEELIGNSGVLLENQVSAICRRFAGARRRKDTHISAAPIAHGNEYDDSALRQIDQCVTFHREFELHDSRGVQLIVRRLSKRSIDGRLRSLEYSPRRRHMSLTCLSSDSFKALLSEV